MAHTQIVAYATDRMHRTRRGADGFCQPNKAEGRPVVVVEMQEATRVIEAGDPASAGSEHRALAESEAARWGDEGRETSLDPSSGGVEDGQLLVGRRQDRATVRPTVDPYDPHGIEGKGHGRVSRKMERCRDRIDHPPLSVLQHRTATSDRTWSGSVVRMKRSALIARASSAALK